MQNFDKWELFTAIVREKRCAHNLLPQAQEKENNEFHLVLYVYTSFQQNLNNEVIFYLLDSLVLKIDIDNMIIVSC